MSAKSNIESLSAALDVANRVMVASLITTALAAIVVAVSTYLIIQWQGRLDKLKDAEFATYKVEAGKAVAEAGAVAATANAKALAAELALARFKAPRAISPDLFKVAAEPLEKFAGQDAAIFTVEGNEPTGLASEIQSLLALAKWHAPSWRWSANIAVTGVAISVKENAPQATHDAAETLAAVLIAAGIGAKVLPWPGEWKDFGLLNGPTFNVETPIRMIVGTKPQ